MRGPSPSLRVFLTRPPRTHSAYIELVGTPPTGVSYTWDDSAGPAGALSTTSLAARVLRTIRLPNLRPASRVSRDADVIHSLQALLVTRRPWVVDIEHGMPFVGIHFDRYQHRLTRAVIARLVAGGACKAVLPWTRTAAEGFLATFGENRAIRRKVMVVHPAMPALPPREESSTSGCCFLFVANIPAHNFLLKGGRELLLAFRELVRRHSTARLIIVGPRWTDGSDLASVTGVEWAGVVDRQQLEAFYRVADVFVMPSASDTFGMVYLEAMAHGIPVVALKRPYTNDIIDEGRTGLLVPMGSAMVNWCASDGRFVMNSDTFIARMIRSEPDSVVVAGLLQRLDMLVEHTTFRRQLGAAGRLEVAEGRFSIEQRNLALQGLYEAAVGTCGRPS
jgi:glycosyltransferase involved in cell wall biosynthesis